jgi:hypothetical protein
MYWDYALQMVLCIASTGKIKAALEKLLELDIFKSQQLNTLTLAVVTAAIQWDNWNMVKIIVTSYQT